MNRKAFKLRMQNLKSYQELNPGKGYWDWKALALEEGGEVKAANPWIDNWNQQAYSTGKFENQLGNGNLEVLKASRDSAPVYRSALKYGFEVAKRLTDKYQPELRTTDRKTYTSTVMDMAKKVRDNVQEVNPNNTPGFGIYNEATNVIYSNHQGADLHEQAHASKALPQLQRIKEIVGDGTDEYWDHPDEIYARLMEFRKGTGMDPTKRDYTIDDINKMRQDRSSKVFVPGGVKKEDGRGLTLYKDVITDPYHILDRYTPELVKEIFNTVADTNHSNDYNIPMVAEGGEIPPNRTSYDRTNPYTGKPLATGAVKTAFDLEDAANMTPLGDALSVRDTYNAVKENDWLGAGLAMLTMVPFVPMTVKEFRKKYKGVTPKYKADSKLMDQAVLNQVNAMNLRNTKATDLRLQANNEGYRIAERLTDDPSYMARAAEVLSKFGDDYTSIYADIIQDYNTNPSMLPKAVLDANIDARAKIRPKSSIRDQVEAGTKVPGKGEFEIAVNPQHTDLAGDVTLHEWNHYVDFIKNKSPHADSNSNLFYLMSKDINSTAVRDGKDLYYSLPTEQKAYMNQLREYLLKNRKITRRSDKVSPSTIRQALNSIKNIDKYRSVVRASKLFDTVNKYTKWFNSIPLLGVGAIGVNNYYNNYQELLYE